MTTYRVELEAEGINLSQYLEIELSETIGNLDPTLKDNLIVEADQWINTALGLKDLAERADNARVYLVLNDDTEIELEGSI